MPRPARRLAPWHGDMATLAVLVAILGLIVAYLTALSPTQFSAGVERYPPTLIFRNFYGVETNEGGAYRWGKSSAALSFPIDAPTTYQVSLRLGDAPTAVPRPVTVYVNGIESGTITPAVAARDYPLTIPISREAWARNTERTLTIELITRAFVPPGDQRPLGALLSGITVTPTAMRTGGFGPLFGVSLLALLTLYGASRLVARSWRGSALVIGASLGALGLFALAERSAALWLVCQPLRSPPGFVALLLLIFGLALLARAAMRAELPHGSFSLEQPRGEGPPDTRQFWSRRSWPLLPILALASGLRLYQFGRLNLWFDEGATIRFAKLPWPEVLGLRGQYEPHPPLYYAAVKLTELALPVVSAGRVLSIVVGVATVAVVYALAVRLLGRTAGVVAAAILALSPLHIWYSREARMYALSTLLIGLAALALIGFAQADTSRARWGWAALYGLACLLAMYVVYSSLYPLVAQGAILILLTWRFRGRAAPLWAALGVAAVAYLPWVPQILSGVSGLDNRSGALGPTPTRLRDLLLAMVGLGGVGQRGESYYPGLWETATMWRVPALIVLAVAMVLGLVALARRSVLAALTVGTLLMGTIVVAAVTSVYSPGFAPRTLLPIVLGWALLLGAGMAFRRPRWLSVVARVGIVVTLLCSIATLRAMDVGAEKQQYRQAAETGAFAATFGQPLVAIGYMAAFFDAYAPGLVYVERPYLDRLAERTAAPPAIWLAYGEDPWEDMPAVRDRLAGLGFERLLHRKFGDTIYLDLFAQRGANLEGQELAVDRFVAENGIVSRWQLPSDSGRVAGSGRAAQLMLAGEMNLPRRASLTLPATSGQLYVLRAELLPDLTQGRGLASLSCLDAAGATVAITSTENPGENGRWQAIRTALWCPAGTTQLRIDLDNRGVGAATFRAVNLTASAGSNR